MSAPAKCSSLDLLIASTDPRVTVGYAAPTATVIEETNWTLPYDVNPDAGEGNLLALREDTLEEVAVTRRSAGVWYVLNQDLRNVKMWFGVPYILKATLTTLFMRDRDGQPETQGRTTIRYIDVHYVDTTDLDIYVETEGRDSLRYEVKSKQPMSGTLRVPVASQNKQVTIRIENYGPGVCSLTSADWVAQHAQTSRRV